MIPLPHQPRIVLEEGNRGVYEIDGLYPGYGMTVGNSLRRVLFSSLKGAVITSVKVDNVSHEFSTMPGMLENIVDLTLNLKQIRFKMHDDGPHAVALSIKGEKVITARDLKVPSQLEIVTPDIHIATLTDKKATLSIELVVESGLGYQAASDRGKEKVEIGTIALDASFSPVRSVNYEVENMRVGDRTDYNRLRLSILTDGSIAPQAALKEAATILVDQFKTIAGSFRAEEQPGSEGTADYDDEAMAVEDSEDAVMRQKIDDLNLSTRTLNALSEAGIKQVGQLAKRNEKKMKEIEGLGEKGIQEIRRELGNLGLTLKE
ncbi:MAG: DNA-directed RNA polymerase subunit alpha [Candidatus Sungbacteria bacterium RIFCSPHIGHO2_01_FULL_51_22]|uniref:DNA-directed RNA polymerase subunit alpha n=1 Tax=Candidatus Sungbacteria bacterium RIFCSPHIGHO2_02_FULL_51_29 TaxID=1802273 RepID=A0A1G2KS09_9BACT|nr:MAG: DNA-directed RNA polymerase subunit alpha [Candidatus Sungbacteria bacterium RIFCSPHIGHO2_01_FULL_51_22]OHA02228.1 MAG: DNA-directed RNA polymerase subunit alpha [Candidatus Sungbacteria bacterium RIFCSPHIGHO2_02_FULL_51_29]OHA06053.1 MAG: DNA-directed RNA polymerase subunit alpha [Candidatus Sungbacteria bacterium RIFCSPLOWO2_01_FULL_51_34]